MKNKKKNRNLILKGQFYEYNGLLQECLYNAPDMKFDCYLDGKFIVNILFKFLSTKSEPVGISPCSYQIYSREYRNFKELNEAGQITTKDP